MSLSIVDLSDFRRIARDLRSLDREIPFALSQALNASAELARRELVDNTWAHNIRQRNPNFLKAALSTKGTRATKRSLRVEIYDRLGRASLLQHDRGGAKRPKGSAIAIPSEAIQARRTGKGMPKGMRPRALKNSFRKGNAIVQRVGTYTKGSKGAPGQDNRHLKVVYLLKPSVQIRADVPFHDDFDRIMHRAIPIQFRHAMLKAMATAFRK